VNIRRLRKEVEYHEAEHRRSEEEPDQKSQRSFEDSWKMQLEWTALHLLRHLEPDFTLDQTDTFWTLDGRFPLSRYRMDLRGFLGARTDAVLETLTPERWERFLEADEEAAELLKRLLELGEDAPVPETYKEPGHRWHDLGEINDRLGQHDLGSIFVNAAEREATRRLTWTLIHSPDARAMLSELTRRRDAFVAQEGSMPMHLPSE
jgi:hypothetical protein